MKLRLQLLILASLCLVILGSWGYSGHKTIGLIASNYLNVSAKKEIKSLLGDTSIADACTWADDARKNPKFRHTAKWHFLNLPVGLNFVQFKQTLDTLKKNNIYHALIAQMQKLQQKSTSRQEKAIALKFVMHLVGDLHQPMHVSRAEDKGGNTVQLNFANKGTNLHSLWDSKLLAYTGLNEEEMAEKCKNIPPQLVRKWQSDPIIQWIWESYQISSALYTEVADMKSRKIDRPYYDKHIPTIEKRLQQASVRLAGLLNTAYPNK